MSRTINGGRKVFFDLDQQRPNETHEQFMIRYLERVQVGMESDYKGRYDSLRGRLEELETKLGNLRSTLATLAAAALFLLVAAYLLWGTP